MATHEAVPAPRAHISAPAPRATTTKPVRSLRRTTNGVPPAEKPYRVGPISGTFRPGSPPAFAGVMVVGTPCEPGRAGGFWRRQLGPKMERGRMLRWVAGDEALIASRRIPSVKFAIIEPSKEAHDSLVPVFQCRRTRRPRRREPTSASRPRGPPLPSLRDCFGPLRNGSGPRNDGPGFLSTVTERAAWPWATQSVNRLAMTAGVSPKRHVHRT